MPPIDEFTVDEFKNGASNPPTGVSRRDFLNLSAVTLALAGLGACVRAPQEAIFSFVRQPEDYVPGRPKHYASAVLLGGIATGAVFESHEGRPTRLDGNPEHPASLGAASAHMQACVEELYSPLRLREGKWNEFLNFAKGKNIWLVTGAVSSPTLHAEIARHPNLKWVQHEPLGNQNELEASLRLFGQRLSPIYDFKKCDAVVSLGADFLTPLQYPLAYAKDYVTRKPKLSVVESRLSLTGAAATERLKKIPDKTNSVYLADPLASPETHMECYRRNLNHPAVKWIQPVVDTSKNTSLGELAKALVAGDVDLLLVSGVDLLTVAPQFKELMPRATRSASLSLFPREGYSWSLPISHDLEAWGDARAFDGTITIMQPLISPLYASHSLLDLLLLLRGEEASAHDLLAKTYPESWEDSLRHGVIAGSKSPFVTPKAKTVQTGFSFKRGAELEALFFPDGKLFDGRFANNAWLQELPDPITKLVWGGAALLSAELAQARGIKNGQELEIKTEAGTVKAPAWITPGIAPNIVALPFGNTFNAFAAWPGTQFAKAEVKVLATHDLPVCTQEHAQIEGRELFRGTKKAEKVMYNDHHEGFPKEAWAMTIDLDRCIGCGACTIACQAENNIPSVGREGCARGREMHWIRIDRYYSANTVVDFQPVPCMHCETAPCEAVCPVGATVHGNGGLNQMVYNRCVGTRYCSNNCPYKVRRFNFLAYNHLSENEKMQKNPDVSVRDRGVMEKCTYCVQRINRARLDAELEKRDIRDGEVKTACQTTCPTEAIIFGNKADPDSRVAKSKLDSREFGLLADLGTKPRTTYLSKKEPS